MLQFTWNKKITPFFWHMMVRDSMYKAMCVLCLAYLFFLNLILFCAGNDCVEIQAEAGRYGMKMKPKTIL